MNHHRQDVMSAFPLPLRMGYFLLEPAGSRSRYHGYRGINRLPSYPYFGELEHAHVIEGRPVAFDQPWEEYFDAEDSAELHTNLAIVTRLQREFSSQGVALDVVYIEVAHVPERLDSYSKAAIWAASLERFVLRWRPVHEQLAGPTDHSVFLGFDVSLPEPTFHSFLLHSLDEDERGALPLNDNGLLPNLNDAMRVLDMANELGYSDSPHCIQGIWAVK